MYFHVRRILVSHEDTNDVLQDIWVKIWQNLPKFQGKSSLYSWMYRIATNESINFIRKNKKHQILVRESTEEYLLARLKTDDWIEGDKLSMALQRATAKLPEKQRIIFNLRYYEETKFKDIAVILNISEGGVKSTYSVARKKVEKFIKEALNQQHKELSKTRP